MNILLPDSSGAQWSIKNIRSEYENINVGKNNQQLIIPITIFINHNAELKLPIISNETESHPFKYVYKFDNQIKNIPVLHVNKKPVNLFKTSIYSRN